MAMIQAGWRISSSPEAWNTCRGVAYSFPAARWGCRFQEQVFVDDIVHASMPAGTFSPVLRMGPVQRGWPRELFRGKPYIMGVTAESSPRCTTFRGRKSTAVALRSHNNVERATRDGDFREEIVPVEIPQKRGKPPIIFEKDEHFRPGTHDGRSRRAPGRPSFRRREGHSGKLLGCQ